jgi:hypothetical protein
MHKFRYTQCLVNINKTECLLTLERFIFGQGLHTVIGGSLNFKSGGKAWASAGTGVLPFPMLSSICSLTPHPLSFLRIRILSVMNTAPSSSSAPDPPSALSLEPSFSPVQLPPDTASAIQTVLANERQEWLKALVPLFDEVRDIKMAISSGSIGSRDRTTPSSANSGPLDGPRFQMMSQAQIKAEEDRKKEVLLETLKDRLVAVIDLYPQRFLFSTSQLQPRRSRF